MHSAGAALNWAFMNTLQAPIQAALVAAQLLERLDASRIPVDAHQYRTVAVRLAQLLAEPDIDWAPLLARSPAAAQVYENLRYAQAGLCRAPLERAAAAELAARQAIEKARQHPAGGLEPTASDTV